MHRCKRELGADGSSQRSLGCVCKEYSNGKKKECLCDARLQDLEGARFRGKNKKNHFYVAAIGCRCAGKIRRPDMCRQDAGKLTNT